MAIITNFTNLRGDAGNSIKEVSKTTLTNGDEQLVLGQFLPNGDETDPQVRTTITVPRGNTFDSGGTRPADSNTEGKDGDVFFDTDDDKFYERGETTTGVWAETADFTGEQGIQGFSISASATSNTGLGESNTLTISNTDTETADVTLTVNAGSTGSAGDGFATYADLIEYAIGDTVISNNTQWRALDVVEDTNTTAPVEGDVWSEIITASQGSSGPELFSFTGETAVLSTLDIVFSGSWTATAAHGITILGLPTSITTDGRGNLDLRLDAVVGIWGNIAGSWRVFTTVGRGGNASDFIDDMVSIIGNPLINSETDGNPIVTFNEGTITTDLFNITAEKVGSNTLRLTGTAGQFDGVTIVIDGSALGMTLQTGYGSNTLTEGSESTIVPLVDITYAQGAIVFYPDTNPVGYMQLANGSITTSNPAVAAELPGTLTTWKPMTS